MFMRRNWTQMVKDKNKTHTLWMQAELRARNQMAKANKRPAVGKRSKRTG